MLVCLYMDRAQIRSTILFAISIAGILAVAAIAPNVIQVLGKLPGSRRYFPSHIKSRVGRLHDQGLITFVEKNGRRFTRLTEKGESELHRQQLIKKSKTHQPWDGLWRIVIFDIREYKRNVRDKIRNELKQFGFKQLQQSVWVYPHECDDIITLLKADNHVGREVLYVEAKMIENDKWLKKEFGLLT